MTDSVRKFSEDIDEDKNHHIAGVPTPNNYCRPPFRACTIMVLLLAMGASAAMAQKSLRGKNDSDDEKKITVQVKLSQDKIHVGSACRAMLIVNIQNGWHINSATPSEENYIGTSVEFREVKGVKIAEIRYPNGIERKLDFADTPLDVYEGIVHILFTFNVATDMKPGTHTIPISFGYQACNDNICLAPATVQVDMPIHVVSRSEKVSRTNHRLFDVHKDERKE